MDTLGQRIAGLFRDDLQLLPEAIKAWSKDGKKKGELFHRIADWRTLKLFHKHEVDFSKSGEDRRVDLVYEIGLSDKPMNIYVLFEGDNDIQKAAERLVSCNYGAVLPQMFELRRIGILMMLYYGEGTLSLPANDLLLDLGEDFAEHPLYKCKYVNRCPFNVVNLRETPVAQTLGLLAQ